jgi:hypothetical protein
VEKAKPTTSGSPAARRLAGGSVRGVAWGERRGIRGGGRLAGSHARQQVAVIEGEPPTGPGHTSPAQAHQRAQLREKGRGAPRAGSKI